MAGYPIESVTISGPNSLSFDCLTSSSSGDVTCSSTDKINYVVNVNNFKLEYAGDYKCTVETKWYKIASASAIVNSASGDVTLSYGNTYSVCTCFIRSSLQLKHSLIAIQYTLYRYFSNFKRRLTSLFSYYSESIVFRI